MDNNILLKKSVFWKKHHKNNGYWYLIENDKIIFLRLNNFPEEPLWTIINELDIIDLDETPSNWTLENLGKK